MLTLLREMTYRFTMRGPLASTDGSPLGEREYYEMTAGKLYGDRINAEIAMPGGDWMDRSADGFSRPNVRVQLVTDDGATILLHYTGLVHRTEAFIQAASDDRETDWSEVNMRMSMRFDTGAEKYAWLNESLFLAEGRLLGVAEIEYAIYRVA